MDERVVWFFGTREGYSNYEIMLKQSYVPFSHPRILYPVLPLELSSQLKLLKKIQK